MKLLIKKETIVISTFVLLSSIATAAQAYKTMPPTFSYDQNAEKVLSEYPIGKINMSDAFSHHGAPVRKLILPNGNRGWLYSTGRDVYTPNLYILQFSDKDIVIDVLHKSLHYKNGHSALQYQFLQSADPALRLTGPGPGQ
ncbi:MAG: hypothetical protein HKP62_02505 [Sulfurovum sp.]|nr:hypothetical protein [Sulfurovum sp.]NNJ44865.1 hypothetical protein [Sulfurovum sp.]